MNSSNYASWSNEERMCFHAINKWVCFQLIKMMYRSMSAKDMMAVATQFQREMEKVYWLLYIE